jgi:hypothetical protein
MSAVKRLILSAVIVFSICGTPKAANHGAVGGQILNMFSSARIMGMGNAGVGIVSDINSVVYNPAGLRWMEKSQIQLSHAFYYIGTTYSSVSAGHNFGEDLYNLGIGFKIKYFGLEDTLRDATGLEGERFDIRFMEYILAAGFPLKYRHSLGISLKGVTEKIYKDSGTAFLVDLGWQYNFSERKFYRMLIGNQFGVASFKNRKITEKVNILGAAVRNISGGINTGGGSSDVPLELAVGGAHGIPQLYNLVVAWEAVSGKETPAGIKLGLESELQGFKARIGAIYITNPQITCGFGIPEKNWNIDYGLFWHLDMGLAHRISVGAHF